MGVQGAGEYGHAVPILSPPLGGSLVPFCPGRKEPAPQGGTLLAITAEKLLLRRTKQSDHRPLIRLAFGQPPSPQGEGL